MPSRKTAYPAKRLQKEGRQNKDFGVKCLSMKSMRQSVQVKLNPENVTVHSPHTAMLSSHSQW